MARPDLSLVPESFHNYINQVPEDDLMAAFKSSSPALFSFLKNIPVEKRDYRYAEGKWTVKEILQHLIDGERVFDYRALRFARKDPTPLPGFDENLWGDNAKAENRDWDDLVEELKVVRRSSEILFGSFDEEQMNAVGTSNNAKNTVIAMGFTIVGHPIHHMKVIRERYLSNS